MTIELINAMVLSESNIGIVMGRLLDLETFYSENEGEVPYTLYEDEDLPIYDRILIHSALTLPSLAVVEADFAAYKAELVIVEEARLAEIARVEALEARIDAISDIRGALGEAGLDIPNAKLELKRIINENDEERLALLESSFATHQVRETKRLTKEARKNSGKAAREVCNDILDLIAGFNLERSLTTEQIDTLKTTFATAKAYLSDGQPWGAKAAISVITPDEVLITQDILDDILEEFTDSGLPGL